jgi:hypothetical protein
MRESQEEPAIGFFFYFPYIDIVADKKRAGG